MTREKALEILRAIEKLQFAGGSDIERDHSRADDVLCDLLESLGHKDIVEAYNNIDKWCA